MRWNREHSDAVSVYLLTSRYLETDANGNVRPKGGSAADGRAISADVRQAITGLLNALRAYGEALQSLTGDAAGSTFDRNADSLAKSAANLDTSLLWPLGGEGLPTGTRLNAVGQAVKDVGNAVITFLIAKDVQSAARNVQARSGHRRRIEIDKPLLDAEHSGECVDCNDPGRRERMEFHAAFDSG